MFNTNGFKQFLIETKLHYPEMKIEIFVRGAISKTMDEYEEPQQAIEVMQEILLAYEEVKRL